MGKDLEEYFKNLEISRIFGDFENTKRSATIFLILAMADSKDEVEISDIKGYIYEDIPNKEVRTIWGTYEDKDIRNTFSYLRDKGLVNREENSRSHEITSRGKDLLDLYRTLIWLRLEAEQLDNLEKKNIQKSIKGSRNHRKPKEGLSKESKKQFFDDLDKNEFKDPNDVLVEEELFEKLEREKEIGESKLGFSNELIKFYNLLGLIQIREKTSLEMGELEEDQLILDEVKSLLEEASKLSRIVTVNNGKSLMEFMEEELEEEPEIEDVNMYDKLND